jgi:peroxiredoxin
VEMTDVLKLVVAGEPNDMPLPTPESLKPYAPFTDADVPTTFAQTREWRMELGDSTFHINEAPFNPHATEAPPIVLGTAEEWTLRGVSGGHPFHVHVNPFAVPLPAGDPSGNRWVWRDTLFVEHGQSVKVRSNFKTFDGRTVLHCHILDHEDQGMMKAIEIVPPAPMVADAATDSATSRPPAPEWQLKGLAGQTVGLRTFLDDPVIVVFHRGFACEHCAEQITVLAKHQEAVSAAGIELIAICPDLPGQQDLMRICRDAGIRFPLLADPKLATFRSFGCLDRDGDPLHGVFLIDRAGRIAWSKVGQEPELAVDEILAKARRTITASNH